MKSLFKLNLFAFMVILTIFVACNNPNNGLQPETAVKPDQIQQALMVLSTQIFRLDGVDVTEGTFALDDPDRFIVLERVSENLLVINGFTSKEAFLQFGDDNGWNFRLNQKMEENLAALAESLGAIAEEEKTAKMPYWWNKYVDDFITVQENALDSLRKRSKTTKLYEKLDADITGDSTITVSNFRNFSAVLNSCGMNNNISSFKPAPLFKNIEMAYDKTFFRNRMFVYVSRMTGTTAINENFDGSLSIFNDEAGSWVSGGL